MIFAQLNEKMRAMDRSLLEKIAADIEMVDKNEGLCQRFLLIYFSPIFLFYNLRKYQKTTSSQMFSGFVEGKHWLEVE